MGGIDKGLQLFLGIPLALHALQRLSPQVGQIAINANRHLAEYEAMGAPRQRPGIQFVPARGTWAIAAASTVRATRSSRSM